MNPLACTGNSSNACADGYTSNLCGVCASGWGTSMPFKCRKCWSKASIITVYIVAGLLMLGFAKLLCYFTLSNNAPTRGPPAGQQAPPPAPSDLLKPFFVYLQFMFVVASMQGIDWPATMSAHCKASPGCSRHPPHTP
jgi:hypothetical protein